MIGPTCYFLGMHLTNVKFQKIIEDHLSGRIDRPDFIFYVNALIQFTLTYFSDSFTFAVREALIELFQHFQRLLSAKLFSL